MRSFDSRVVAVTGAGSGIGRALAVDLAGRGALLALSDVSPEGLAETVDLVKAAGVREVRSDVVDVAAADALAGWAEDVVGQFGRVNVLVSNAGVSLTGEVSDLDPADMEWIVGINFWGVVNGTRAFLPHLIASGDGAVVNISSLFGLFAQPGMSGYNASKFAVRGFTEALRQELDLQRCGVSATCVHPGGIRTDICRSSRIDANMTGFLIHSEQQARADFEKLFITDADQAAKVILQGVRKNKRRVLIGRDAYFLDLLARCLPAAYQALVVLASKRMAPKQRRPVFETNDEPRL